MTIATPPRPTSAWLTSPVLTQAGFSHAFFTRQGGVSTPPYESLNFSAAVGDDPTRVEENLRIAADALGVKSEQVCFLSQVHGRRVVVLNDPQADRRTTLQLEGDAVMSNSPTQACGVRTADCVPILLASPATGWVAAVHAGWRGCAYGVVVSTVEALQAEGAGRLIAAIGPHISNDAFEVSTEVANELRAASPDNGIVDESRAKPHVDLRRMVRAQLKHGGLLPEDIDDVMGCTYLQPDLFFSFRRDGAVSGRHLSAIVPRQAPRS